MKTIVLIFSLALTLSIAAQMPFVGIQDTIDNAMNASFECNSATELEAVLQHLETIENDVRGHWKEYWTAYAKYNHAIYLTYGSEEVDAAKEEIASAIQLLENLEDKNSEDYALLANIQGYSLQWISGFSIIAQSKKAEDWGKQAMEIDPQNPRALYVCGSNDYYKPSFVGGGKKAAKLFAESISLYEQWIPNPMLPSWGYVDAYAKLVSTHIKKDNTEEAKTILAKGLSLFPEDRDLLSLQKKLD